MRSTHRGPDAADTRGELEGGVGVGGEGGGVGGGWEE